MGKALTQLLQSVADWNAFPLENAYSSKPKSFTEIGWFRRTCCKVQVICQLTSLAGRLPSLPSRAAPDFQTLELFAACQAQHWETTNEVGQPHGSGLQYPHSLSAHYHRGCLGSGDYIPSTLGQLARSPSTIEKAPKLNKIRSVQMYSSCAN